MDHFKGFPDLPPIWFLGAYATAHLLTAYLPIVEFGIPGATPTGYLLIALGLGLILWAALWFYAKKTRIEPHKMPTALIVEGPFRLSRNPIYLGLFLILAGVVLRLCALSPFIVLILFPIILTSRFIKDEEARLREAFGAQAEQYFQRTGRWISRPL